MKALAQKHGRSRLHCFAKVMRSKNEQGAVAAAKELLDCGYGKATQGFSARKLSRNTFVLLLSGLAALNCSSRAEAPAIGERPPSLGVQARLDQSHWGLERYKPEDVIRATGRQLGQIVQEDHLKDVVRLL